MKKHFLVLIIFLITFSAYSQEEEFPRYVYCDVQSSNKMMSKKVTITLDFGEKLKAFAGNRLKDPKTGKVRVFNTMIDALNFMGKSGWDLVQTYAVDFGSGVYVYHNIMKLPYSDLDEEARKEVMSVVE